MVLKHYINAILIDFPKEALSNQMYSIDKMAASGIYTLLALIVLTIIVILLLTTSKEIVIIS